MLPLDRLRLSSFLTRRLLSRSRGATVDVLPSNFTFLNLGGSVLSGDFKVDMNNFLSREPPARSCRSATRVAFLDEVARSVLQTNTTV